MYNYLKNTNYSNWINYVFALIIIALVVLFSNRLVNQLKKEEATKVKSMAEAFKLIGSDNDLNADIWSYLFNITEQNTTIPILILENDNKTLAFYKNIDSIRLNTFKKKKALIHSFKSSYPPILINLKKDKQYLYYKNSKLLNQLEYYPYLVIVLIILFVIFTLWYFKTITKTEQSYLWAGLAKETAHQIGTPLSSIMSWLELLKLENNTSDALNEIENDVNRLQFITDRFSKIGSEADLNNINIIETTKQNLNYLKKRISNKVTINYLFENNKINANINAPLFNWVIENLVKNAVDSLKNKGEVNIHIFETKKWITIDVTDNGPGIIASQKKQIFKPGFSSKKRGWGLGLSLAKRIIENYHKGKIFLLKSDPNKETTFRILLKK